MKTAFKPKPGINRVCIGSAPRVVISGDAPFSTDDPDLVARLDRHPSVQRHTTSKPAEPEAAS